ncbi:MAG: hypothetical protein LBH21_06490 [Gracilibacteraceae bacterium]|nr:hypothetical protein [Gracilibacteraceae bacterium]
MRKYLIAAAAVLFAGLGAYALMISGPDRDDLIYKKIYNAYAPAPFAAKEDKRVLILDLTGDGVKVLGPQNGVRFDMNADGRASAVAWIGGDDAFLAMDLNGNGVIDDGNELLSDQTPLAGGGYLYGYNALRLFDENGDELIDASDAAYAPLLAWRDQNGDGVSQAEELLSLAEIGVASLRFGFYDVYIEPAETGATSNSPDWKEAAQIGEYFFSEYLPETANPGAAPPFAPEIPADYGFIAYNPPGAGAVPSLQQAMLLDESGELEELVYDLDYSYYEFERFALLDPIIAGWAGVGGVAPGSRGPNIDAGQLTALEKFAGKPFAGEGNDAVSAGPGSIVFAGEGDDAVSAGAGSVVFAGPGDDAVYGGGGDQTYIFCLEDGSDTITDFNEDPNPADMARQISAFFYIAFEAQDDGHDYSAGSTEDGIMAYFRSQTERYPFDPEAALAYLASGRKLYTYEPFFNYKMGIGPLVRLNNYLPEDGEIYEWLLTAAEGECRYFESSDPGGGLMVQACAQTEDMRREAAALRSVLRLALTLTPDEYLAESEWVLNEETLNNVLVRP